MDKELNELVVAARLAGAVAERERIWKELNMKEEAATIPRPLFEKIMKAFSPEN